MAIVAAASVKVSPDLSEFRRDLSKGLKSIKADFVVNVRADTTRAKADIERFVAQQSGKDIEKNLDLDTDKATRAVRKFQGELDLSKALSKAQGALTPFLKAGLGLAKVAALFSAVQLSAGTLGPLLAGAAGSAALLPAALFAAVGIMATLKLGADGVKKAFEGLKPTLDTLKSQVSASFESALIPAVNNLKTILPGLRTGFQSIATALGGVVTQTTNMLKSGQKTQQLNSLFLVTSQIVQNIGKGLAPFISGLLNIGEIGIPVFKQLTSGIGAAAEKFNAWTASAEGGEKIAAFIQGAIDAFKQLFAILKQLGGIVANVFSGLSSGGASLGSLLLPALTAINEALGSDGMQAALGAIGTALREVGTSIGMALGPVVKTVLPLLGQALLAAAPGIQALVNGLGELIKGIAPALPAVGQLASVLGQGLGKVASALGPVLGDLATALANGLAEAIPPLVPVIVELVQALGKILTAIAPLIGPIIQLATAALQPILSIVTALTPVLVQLVNSALMALKPIIPPITAAFTQLGDALAPLAMTLGNALLQVFQAMLPLIAPMANLIVQLVQAFLPLIPVVTSVIQILTPIIALAIQIAVSLTNMIVQGITPVVQAFGVVAQVVGSTMTAVNNVISKVVGAVTSLFSGLVSKISGSWSSITGTISGAVDRVKNAVTSGFNNVVSFIGSIPGRIMGALGNLGSLLFNAGADVIRGLINGIKSMIGSAISAVVGVGKSIIGGIKGALGIGSPSKEFAKIGVWSMQGYDNGLDKGFVPVEKHVNELSDRIKNAFGDPGLEMSSAVSSALSGTVQASAELEQRPVNVIVSGDEKGLRQFVNVEIQEDNQNVLRFSNARKRGN